MAAVCLRVLPVAGTCSRARDLDGLTEAEPLPLGCACRLRALGLPCRQSGIDLQPQAPSLYSHHFILAGEVLFRQGAPFSQIHAVRSGAFKTMLGMADGRNQVCSFQFPGDLLGFDGAYEGRHRVSVVALEDSQTCAFAYGPLMLQAGQARLLRQGLHGRMSDELARGKSHIALLAGMKSSQRLASFLLDMSQRARARGLPPSEFQLPMTRADIGSYLGMTLETVSRVLTSFEQRGHLKVACRHICITDLPGLRLSLAGLAS